MGTIKMSCIFWQVIEFAHLRTFMNRIHVYFQNKNMSSTFVDIVNNIPEIFNLDMPGRISDMTSCVQLRRNAYLINSLTSDVVRSWLAELMSLLWMEISHLLSQISSIICQERYKLDMPDRISVMSSWVQLWRDASFFRF